MSLGFPELFFIALFALIVIGPKDLPRVASKVGRWWAEFQRMKNDAMSTLTEEVRALDSDTATGATGSKGALALETRLKNVAAESALEQDQRIRRMAEDAEPSTATIDSMIDPMNENHLLPRVSEQVN